MLLAAVVVGCGSGSDAPSITAGSHAGGLAGGSGPHAHYARITTAAEWQLRPHYGQRTGFGLALRAHADRRLVLRSVVIHFDDCLTLRSPSRFPPQKYPLDGVTVIDMRGTYRASTPAGRSACIVKGGGAWVTAEIADVTFQDGDDVHRVEVSLGDPAVLFVPTR